MKIVNRYLIELPIFVGTFTNNNKIFEVVELENGNFYRAYWNKGNLLYEKIDKEVIFEAIHKSEL